MLSFLILFLLFWDHYFLWVFISKKDVARELLFWLESFLLEIINLSAFYNSFKVIKEQFVVLMSVKRKNWWRNRHFLFKKWNIYFLETKWTANCLLKIWLMLEKELLIRCLLWKNGIMVCAFLEIQKLTIFRSRENARKFGRSVETAAKSEKCSAWIWSDN